MAETATSQNPSEPSERLAHYKQKPIPDSTATMAGQTEDHSYHPKDAIQATMKTTMLTGGVGLFASAVQNTLTRKNVGPFGVFVRSGSTIGVFGMDAIGIGQCYARLY